MKGIELCGECVYCDIKSYKCTLGCNERGEDAHFFVNCPLPDVQPVKHGQWVCEFYNDVFDVYQADCSVCKRESTNKYDKVSESYEYCPHCGAKMDLKEGNTDG